MLEIGVPTLWRPTENTQLSTRSGGKINKRACKLFSSDSKLPSLLSAGSALVYQADLQAELYGEVHHFHLLRKSL